MHYKTIANEYWPQIEVVLKHRLRLTAHLLQTAQGTMQHEKKVLAILNAICIHDKRHGSHFDHRSERIKAEFKLSEALNELLSAAQNYPDLMTNEPFLKCKSVLSSTQAVIEEGAHLYNTAAREMNKWIRIFPNQYIMIFFEVELLPYFSA